MALTLTNDILKFRESTSDPWERLLIQANMNFNLIYPVGSIYMSTVNVDPGTIFGGTWEQLKDTFLLGAGDNYTAGDTGGEATHTLTESEMPVHNGHITDTPSGGNLKAYLNKTVLTSYGSGGRGWWEMSGSEAYPVSQNRGSGGAHNNMPPYLVVYMWRRLTLSPTVYTPPANVLIGEVASEDIVPIAKGGTGLSSVLSTNVSVTFSGVSATLVARRFGRVVELTGSIGDGTAFSSATGLDVIGTLPSGYIPTNDTYCTVAPRNTGAWASATYYNAIIYLNSGNGEIQVRGNANSLKSSVYIPLSITYVCAE